MNLLLSLAAPLIDFIFVHGLGGGAGKAWSESPSLVHFWPQEWLPKTLRSRVFEIHSFGYDSDLIMGKDSCLIFHHSGKAFLGEMSTFPYLANTGATVGPIGHSMGGLVMKKAYIPAEQDTACRSLVKIKKCNMLCRNATMGSWIGEILDQHTLWNFQTSNGLRVSVND